MAERKVKAVEFCCDAKKRSGSLNAVKMIVKQGVDEKGQLVN